MARIKGAAARRRRVVALVTELEDLLEACFQGELQPVMERAKKALGLAKAPRASRDRAA
jgi:hypothetical protein